jgi:hypothetical protein
MIEHHIGAVMLFAGMFIGFSLGALWTEYDIRREQRRLEVHRMTPIGADVFYSWDENPTELLRGYISFAGWEDDRTHTRAGDIVDRFGVNDLDIFFYSDEWELVGLMGENNGSGFRVFSYDYRY